VWIELDIWDGENRNVLKNHKLNSKKALFINIFFVQSLKGLPGASANVPTTSDYGIAAPLSTIPGSENEFKQDQRPFARVMLILNTVLSLLLAIPDCNPTLAGC
jgi:hypothetical protein